VRLVRPCVDREIVCTEAEAETIAQWFADYGWFGHPLPVAERPSQRLDRTQWTRRVWRIVREAERVKAKTKRKRTKLCASQGKGGGV
jgi:hypothetical protein